MGTKLFVVSMMIIFSATAVYGFSVGVPNGAIYFVGGPPATNTNSFALGTPQVGGTINQHAVAFNPGGFSAVGQSAHAAGGQLSGSGGQAQGFCGSLSQGAALVGGTGQVAGTQGGTAHMSQGTPSGSAVQSMHATGLQDTRIYGYPGGISASAETEHVGTSQLQRW